jgi:predicted lysophospholipase L1 biosynthesis ABC-type transport system permease subunit
MVQIAGLAPPPKKTPVGLFYIGPGFFEAMQIPLLAGRELDERDESGRTPAALVNQRFLKVFGLENPLGRTVILGTQTYQIAGVVGDAHFMRLKEEQYPMLYMPFSQPGQVTFEVRAAGNPMGFVGAVREVVRQLDSRLAMASVETQGARIDREISQEITLARLCRLFAGLALSIACVGLYATVAFQVTRRTSEIGIRMALGAQRKGIVVLVLREVLAVSVVGLAVGVTAALWGSRFVASFLYGVRPRDPQALAVAVAMLLTAATLAGFVPARRASRIDPMSALRHE